MARLLAALGQPIDVSGDSGTMLMRARANRVFLSSLNGRVLSVVSVQRGSELPLLYRWVHAPDPLHFGTMGGLATQLISFGFRLELTTLAFSGA